jgi:hypothetical protein
MKTIIGFILALMLFTSCLTVKRIEKNCDKFAKVCVTDSKTVVEYRDTVIYKDRIVQVVLPKDTVKIVDTLYIEDNKCFLPLTKKTFGNIWASAKVDNSILDLKAGYVKNIIQVPIHDTIYIEKAVTNTTTDNTVTVVKKYIPKVYKWAFWILLIEVILVVMYFLNLFGVLGQVGNIKNIFKKKI